MADRLSVNFTHFYPLKDIGYDDQNANLHKGRVTLMHEF